MAPLNVGPRHLIEMAHRLVDSAEQKEQLAQLLEQYACKRVDKNQVLVILKQIVSSEVLLQVMRTLVPGYDEMRAQDGILPPPERTPTQPSEKPSAANGPSATGVDVGNHGDKASAAASGDTASAGLAKLKPGFLTGGLGANGADAAPSAGSAAHPPPPTGDDVSDMQSLRHSIYAQKAESMPKMNPEPREHLMHNDFVMHDAKHAGNQGNVVLDASGRAVVRDDESMGGQAGSYSWGQNELEVTVKAVAPAGLKAKDVELRVRSQAVTLKARGVTVLDGRLQASVLPDECTYCLEDEPNGAGRLVVLTLVKASKTAGKGHWPRVVEDGPSIDTSRFGPAVFAANPDSPHELARAIEELKLNKGT